MKIHKQAMERRLIILDSTARFTANRKVRQMQVPWIFHVIRFNGVLRVAGDWPAPGENQSADGRICITKAPCIEE